MEGSLGQTWYKTPTPSCPSRGQQETTDQTLANGVMDFVLHQQFGQVPPLCVLFLQPPHQGVQEIQEGEFDEGSENHDETEDNENVQSRSVTNLKGKKYLSI